MGFGIGFGSFMEGYQKTMSQRHAERERMFTQYMDTAKTFRDYVDKERAKPIWNEHTIKEAELNAEKYEKLAEKSINEKIGGLTKLGGLLKNAMARQQGGLGAAPGGETSSGGPPAGQAASAAPAAEQAGTPAAPAAPAQPQPPELLGETPGRPSGIMPPPMAPPPDVGGTTAAAKAEPEKPAAPTAGVSSIKYPKGYGPNLYLQASQESALDQARAMAKIQSDSRISEAVEIQKQEHKNLLNEFDSDIAPDLKAAGLEDKAIAAARVNFASAGKVKVPGFGKPIVVRSPTAVTDESGKDVYLRWRQEDDGSLTPLEPIPAGKTAAMRNASAKFQQAVDVYKKVHPETSDEDAQTAVATEQRATIEGRAKLQNLHIMREEQLIAVSNKEEEYKTYARELKKRGGITSNEAATIMHNFDAMAQAQLLGDVFEKNKMSQMTGDEVVQAIVDRSNSLLKAAGWDRNWLMKQATGKPMPSIEEKTSEAKKSLAQPPGGGSKTTEPAKKTGPYNP